MFEEDFKEEKVMRKELDDCLSKEEVYWRQKSREVWLKEGDGNTKFFHNSVKIQRENNKSSQRPKGKIKNGLLLDSRERLP